MVVVGAGVIGYVVGVLLQAQVGPGSKYESFLLLISYWIGPFLGVVLTDYFLRRGHYVESEFYDLRHRPWQGFAAMVAGLIVSLPFWNVSGVFTGPVPASNPAVGDITFIVGMLVAGLVHALLSLGLRRRALAATYSS